eukprot:7929235-Pyramimonas_sp.AAC.3
MIGPHHIFLVYSRCPPAVGWICGPDDGPVRSERERSGVRGRGRVWGSNGCRLKACSALCFAHEGGGVWIQVDMEEAWDRAVICANRSLVRRQSHTQGHTKGDHRRVGVECLVTHEVLEQVGFQFGWGCTYRCRTDCTGRCSRHSPSTEPLYRSAESRTCAGRLRLLT